MFTLALQSNASYKRKKRAFSLFIDISFVVLDIAVTVSIEKNLLTRILKNYKNIYLLREIHGMEFRLKGTSCSSFAWKVFEGNPSADSTIYRFSAKS